MSASLPGSLSGGPGAPMRWFAGVPIVTNPLLLQDLFRAAVAVWVGVFFLALLVQFAFGGVPGGEEILAAFAFAGWLPLFLFCVFAVFGVVFFRNRYVALYRFDADGVYCESMVKRGGPLKESLHLRPFPVGEILEPARSVVKTLPWEEIDAVRSMEDMLVVLLKKKGGVRMRLYCPDEMLFSRVLSECALRLEEKNEGKGGE